MTWNLSNISVFSISPDSINIDSYCTGYCTISFKPIAIEYYETYLEITYDVPQNQKQKFLKILITGEGYVPEVVVLDPLLDPYFNTYSVLFNPVLVNDYACKAISFQNVGLMKCKVILEVDSDVEDVFALIPHEDTVEYLQMWRNHGI